MIGKKTLVLSERPTDDLDNITITAKAKYSINITKSRKQICSSVHYNAANRFFYANGVKINSKQRTLHNIKNQVELKGEQFFC